MAMFMAPIVSEASYAARRRNYHWEWLRSNPRNEAQDRRGVNPAQDGLYPSKTARSSDVPISDSGGNFGRIARCGIFDDEIDARLTSDALGIPVDAWRRFLQIFADGTSQPVVTASLQGLERAFATAELSATQRELTADLLAQLANQLRS